MKNLSRFLLTGIIFFAITSVASAQFTLLPKISSDNVNCEKLLSDYELKGTFELSVRDDLLGCAIKTGRISLQMVPYFATYFINFMMALSGVICILFIMIGAYWYIWGAMAESKDKGKKTIYHALLGMAISILSWTIVNIILAAVTS